MVVFKIIIARMYIVWSLYSGVSLDTMDTVLINLVATSLYILELILTK